MKKVYPFKIPKSLHESLIVQIDRATVLYDKLHQHEEVQITYVVSGNGKLFVADSIHNFGPGDLFVIPSNSPHLFQNNVEEGIEAHMISLFFSGNTVVKAFAHFPELDNIRSFLHELGAGMKLSPCPDNLAEQMQEFPSLVPFRKFTRFLSLLDRLTRVSKVPLTGFVYPKEISHNEGQRMRAIFEYVTNNFQKEISLNDIADLAYMTPNAFCRFFKQRTNKTFFQFLIELRIEHACQLLAQTHDVPIGEIAYKSGFRSISNFNRKFKELKGMAPSKYYRSMEAGTF